MFRPSFWSTVVTIVLAVTTLPCPAQEVDDSEAAIRSAVQKALPLLRKGSEGHMAQRTCFACHQQTHVLVAMRAAEKFAGIPVDEAFAEANAKHTLRFLARNEEGYKKGNGQGGQVDTAGYALWLLELAKAPESSTTTAVVEYLLQFQAEGGYWRCGSVRPPSEASHFATTYVALRGLKHYATKDQQPRADERIAKIKPWLEKAKPEDTEDAVFQLRAMTLSGCDRSQVSAAASELLGLQREDGGWAQKKEMTSDAYATATVLVALAESDQEIAKSAGYRRGFNYLLKTQQMDGSWKVTTRSKPFQEYFETGFPHEKDQFISSAATGWAVAALSQALTLEAAK